MIAAQQVWPAARAERYRKAGYWTGETMGDFLRAAAGRFTHRVAVTDGEFRWSYSELDHLADRYAAGFLELGFAPSSRVMIHLPNIPEFIAVLFGLSRAGLCPVYTLPAHRQAELIHVAKAAEAVAWITVGELDGQDMQPVIAAVMAASPTLQQVFVRGGSTQFRPLESLKIAPVSVLPDLDASSVAFMQLSGGSTGMSKLIPRTHDDYLYSVRASAEICQLSPQTVFLAVLPIAHNFPMSSPGFLGVLYAGGTIVLSPSPAPETAFPLIERERVNLVALVPPLALAWLEAAPGSRADLSSIQLIQVGGARLLSEAALRLSQGFPGQLQQVFGMAEGLVNYTRLGDPAEIVIRTQGRPISPDDEILVVDDQDHPVPDGTAGHLLTRGPYTISAYHNAPEANQLAFTPDGYYRTGDIVTRHPGGYLEVQGRATDQINRGGEKIAPDEVEDHLMAHASVHDAAVVALPDQWLGERSVAVVVTREPKPTAGELKAWIRERGLAAYKIPDRIIFLDRFPETGVGKVSRKALRAAIRDSLFRRDK